MADPLWGQQLTNMWMLDPTMFDPTQRSNQFSNYNNAPLPGPSYNSDAGGPTNAMGQPIQSFVDWNNNAQKTYQQQLDAYNQAIAAGASGGSSTPGTTINNTGAAATPTGYGPLDQLVQARQQATAGQQQTPYGGAGTNPLGTAAAAGATPQQLGQMFSQMSPTIPSYTDTGQRGGQAVMGPGTTPNPNYQRVMGQLFANSFGGAAPARPAGPTPPTPPNNWMAALNALSQPGNPVTQGANVPMAAGFQPAGGVNQAFLGQVQTPGANQNFLSALAAIQGRPQGQQQQRRTG